MCMHKLNNVNKLLKFNLDDGGWNMLSQERFNQNNLRRSDLVLMVPSRLKKDSNLGKRVQ